MQADLSYTPNIFSAVPCASKEPCKRKLRPCPMLGWQSSLHTLLGHRSKTHHFLQNIDVNFSQTHINTARLIFPRYSLQCQVTFILVTSCCSGFLCTLFSSGGHIRPRGVEATFQHLLLLKEFPLQVLVFLHQMDCNPSLVSSVPIVIPLIDSFCLIAIA